MSKSLQDIAQELQELVDEPESSGVNGVASSENSVSLSAEPSFKVSTFTNISFAAIFVNGMRVGPGQSFQVPDHIITTNSDVFRLGAEGKIKIIGDTKTFKVANNESIDAGSLVSLNAEGKIVKA